MSMLSSLVQEMLKHLGYWSFSNTELYREELLISERKLTLLVQLINCLLFFFCFFLSIISSISQGLFLTPMKVSLSTETTNHSLPISILTLCPHLLHSFPVQAWSSRPEWSVAMTSSVCLTLLQLGDQKLGWELPRETWSSKGLQISQHQVILFRWVI